MITNLGIIQRLQEMEEEIVCNRWKDLAGDKMSVSAVNEPILCFTRLSTAETDPKPTSSFPSCEPVISLGLGVNHETACQFFSSMGGLVVFFLPLFHHELLQEETEQQMSGSMVIS